MSIFDRFRSRPKTPQPPTTPLAWADDTLAAAAGERRSRTRVNARQGATALIIDDSATVIAALRKILLSAGFVTRNAFDAEKGLELIAQEKPDLVFLDIVLPGMNGFNALRAIRKDASTQHIPVIMISGNEHATEQFYANRIGADDFMKKPFSREEVFARIESLLDSNRVPQRKGALPAQPSTPAIEQTQPMQAQAALSHAVAAPIAPTAPIAPVAPAVVPEAGISLARQAALSARKELAAMGLQYFDRAQLFAAIERADQMAVELFVSSAAIGANTLYDGRTAIAFALELGNPQIVALLQPTSFAT